MQHPDIWLNLKALVLVLVVCICGFLPGDYRVFAADSTRKAVQPQPAGQPEEENIWTIGIYTGPSIFKLSPPAGVKMPVLTAAAVSDLDADIVAHPFMVLADSMYYMFFTAKNGALDKGGIGAAESRDGLHWKYRRIVIKEPFVLAYPFVFKWQADYYMIPEAHTETAVRLYRATDFPDKWEYEGDLLTGEHYISASLVRFQDMWWMYVSRQGNETLRLFFAQDLKGPWTEHPLSPVVPKDLDNARPGGRPLVIDGTLYRIGQDCYPTYGNQVFAYQVTEISPTAYKEKKIDAPLVQASGNGWNSEAMHHVDAHQIGENKWIAAVDAQGKKVP